MSFINFVAFPHVDPVHILLNIYLSASLVAQLVKNPLAMRETWVPSLVWKDPLEKGKVIQSSILAWRIPWTHGIADSDMTEQLSLSLSN